MLMGNITVIEHKLVVGNIVMLGNANCKKRIRRSLSMSIICVPLKVPKRENYRSIYSAKLTL